MRVVSYVPLDGSTAGVSRAALSSDHPYNGTVGLVDANTPLTVFADGSSNAQFRRYSGAGSLNDPASWTPPSTSGTPTTHGGRAAPRGCSCCRGRRRKR